jgi:hypothetical protein
MATGENNTTWGDVTNLNLGTALEEAIVGSADVTFASADVTLTLTDTNASQTARNMRLRCTGTTGGSTRNLIVPSIEKPYIVRNDCADSVVVKTAAGTGITVPAGKTMWVYSDATNVVDAVTHLSSLTLGTDLAVSDGGTGASTFTANGVIYGNTTSALLATAAGTTGQVLVGNTGGAPSWATLTGIGVTSFSAGTTGFTPSTATTGAVTLAGTLGVANGGTGTATAFTAGSVVFAGASGVYSQDNANLFWDNTNDRLGIGTTSPASKLDVSGAIRATGTGATISANAAVIDYVAGTTTRLISYGPNTTTAGAIQFVGLSSNASAGDIRAVIDSSGNVGIGTSSPSDKLQVTGGILRVENTLGYGATMLNTSGMGMYMTLADQGNSSAVGTNNGSLIFYNSGNTTERMRIDSSGNVGIGTTAPSSKLNVLDGDIEVSASAGGNTLLSFNGTTASLTVNSVSAPLVFGTSSTERMRITSAGNVGIGCTPLSTTKFQTSIGTDRRFSVFLNGSDNVFGYLTDAGNWADTFLNGSPVRFGIGGTERARIDSSGNLLVGTTSSTGGIAGTSPRLVVEPPNTSTHGVILKSLGQSYDVGLIWNTAASGDNKFFEFGTDATYTARGSIDYNRAGGLVRYNTTSDYRAKDIIGPVQNPGATIDALKVYEGVMKGATQSRPMLVAHEAQEVTPYAVTGEKDAVNEDGAPKFQQMDVSSLIPLLIAEIQSLRARVAQLEGN